MSLLPFDPSNSTHLFSLVSIWNAACGEDLRITPRFAVFNTKPATGAIQAGRLAIEDNQPVGFVLASVLLDDPAVSSREAGWVDAIAVHPQFQRRGVGGALLEWAEDWLREQQCVRARLGGSLRPFAAGYPVELRGDSFFSKRGYTGRAEGESSWDVARDLGNYEPRYTVSDAAQPEIRPARPGEENDLLGFFNREFPGRWRFKFQEFLRMGGDIANWLILRTERGVDGFARVTFEDSAQPLERFYPYRLPRPWGQLGPIGVSADVRGKGYGGILLDAGLLHLSDRGVRGCVIDWTGLLDFYGKFGFAPYREYAMLVKTLTAALPPL